VSDLDDQMASRWVPLARSLQLTERCLGPKIWCAAVILI
jgi:hypothetical protein